MTRDDDASQDEILRGLLDAVAPMSPPRDLRAKVLGHVRAQTALQTLRADEGAWEDVAPGVRMKVLFVDDQAGTRSFLLRFAPGASLPAHAHRGPEECLVLEGEAMLGDVAVRAGDYHLAPCGSKHGVVSSRTGALLYLRGAA